MTNKILNKNFSCNFDFTTNRLILNNNSQNRKSLPRLPSPNIEQKIKKIKYFQMD